MMYLKLYSIAFLTFLAIDMVWLLLIAKNLYNKALGHILSPTPNLPAAGIFYLIFIAGLVFFVLQPAIEKQQLTYALLAGMFFGFVTYSTYDLTNLATVKDWPIYITIIDLIWGTFLGGSVSTITYIIMRH